MTEGQSGSELESYKYRITVIIVIDRTEMPIEIISQSHQFWSKFEKFGITDGRFVLSDSSKGVVEVVGCSSTLRASSMLYGSLPSSTASDMVASYPQMISRAPTLDDIDNIISLKLVIEDHNVMRYRPHAPLRPLSGNDQVSIEYSTVSY